MTPNAPAPVAAAVERKRRREIARAFLVVMQVSLIGQQTALKALTDLGGLCDGSITETTPTRSRPPAAASPSFAGSAACSAATPCGRPRHCGIARARY